MKAGEKKLLTDESGSRVDETMMLKTKILNDNNLPELPLSNSNPHPENIAVNNPETTVDKGFGAFLLNQLITFTSVIKT